MLERGNKQIEFREDNRLFVYGIFLDEYMRQSYGMSNPKYATVRGYATVEAIDSGTIVEAIPVSREFCLTGMVVDVADQYAIETINGRMICENGWARLDLLEGGYNRIKVDTTDGEECWMYVAK